MNIQLDSVETPGGDCAPIIFSWVEPTFERKCVVAAVGYECGKRAVDYAAEVRAQLQKLGVLKAVQTQLQAAPKDGVAAHFRETYKSLVRKFKDERQMSADQARLAAFISYAFGSATTDHAIVGLLRELVGENSENAGGGQPATADDGDTLVLCASPQFALQAGVHAPEDRWTPPTTQAR